MIQFRHDDFITRPHLVSNRLANQTHERRSVKAKYDLIRIRRIHQVGHSLPSTNDNVVNLARQRVRTAALDHSMNEVIFYGIDHPKRQLGARGIVKKYGAASLSQ